MGTKPWQLQQASDAIRIYRYHYRGAKAGLGVFVHPTGETQHVDQTPEAIDAFVAHVQTLKPALVVLEDTGGY